MADLKTIRAGLAANLGTLADAPHGVQISAYMLDSPTPPTLYVMGPEETIYDLAMQRGLDEWQIVIQGFVGGVTDIGAQVNLDEWLAPSGPNSVKTALESDRTLGGAVEFVQVVSASGYRIYKLENLGAPTLGAEWTCSIRNRGN